MLLLPSKLRAPVPDSAAWNPLEIAIPNHDTSATRARRAALFVLALLGSIQGLFSQAVYVPNYTTSNVSGYLVNPSTGALTPVVGSPVMTGMSPVQALVHPSGKFLYVLDAGPGDVSVYSISAPSGALTRVPCPLCAATSPAGMAMDPAGQLLFVSNIGLGTVTPYTINPATGDLRMSAPVPIGAGSKPEQLVVDPSRRYLYVADSGSGQVSGFAISPSGFLTAVPGSPFAAGSSPYGIAASRTEVFVANQNSGDISVYRIGLGGTLIPAGPPVLVGGKPVSIAVDPSENYVYVANQIQLVAFNTIPNGVFPLTQVRAYSAGITPSAVAIDPRGDFVYAASFYSNDVWGFAISAGGTLIPLGASSTFGAFGPRLLTVRHIGDTTALSLAGRYPANNAPYGTAVQLKGAVTNTSNPGTIPRGSVRFTVNNNAVPNGTIPLDASGGFDFTFNASTQYLPVSDNVLRIVYDPANGFEAPAPLAVAYTVTKAAPNFTITFSPAAPIASQAMTITVSAPQTGGRYPAGTVAFSVDNAVIPGAVPLVNGGARVSYTPATGDHTIALDYDGDSIFAPAVQRPVNFRAKRTTSTTLSSNSASLVYGQAPTLTAAVSAGGRTVTGTVNYYDGTARIGTVNITQNNSLYVAQLSSHKLTSLGQHSITAVYNGDTDNLSSSSAVLLTVSPDSVSVSTPAFSGPLTYGQSLTFTATVTAVAPGSGIPSGTMTFKDGAVTLGTAALVAATATFTTSALGAGSHSITAVYIGDANFLAATSAAAPITVARAAPALSVSAAPASGLVSGQAVTLLTVLSGGTSATGTVDFFDAGVKINAISVPVNAGQAQLTSALSGARTHVITAVYSGDANYKGVDNPSNSFHLAVGQASVTVGIPIASGMATFGWPQTFTAQVSGLAPGSGAPTGAVAFKDGTILLGMAALAAGSASLTIPTFAAGSHFITAAYTGDTNFLPAASSSLSFTEDQAASATTLSIWQDSTSTGLRAVVSGSAADSPTGTVQFFNDTASLGIATLSSISGFANASLSVGAITGTVRAVYSGDGNFRGSTSAAQTITPAPKPTAKLTLQVSPNPAMAGQVITLTAKLSWSGGTTPGGNIQFYDGSTLLWSGQAKAQVTFATTLPAGDHRIVATYTGDASYPSSLDNAGLMVNKNGGMSLVLTSDMGQAVFGQAVTFAARLIALSAAAAAVPTGQVQFLENGTMLGSALLVNGVAILKLSNLAAGSHQITGIYSGDSNFTSASANRVSVTVAKAATLVSISTKPGLPESMQVTAKVAVVPPGLGLPDGTVQFVDAAKGQVLGTAALNGETATASVSLEADSIAILAVYSGNAGFLGSSSAPAAQFFVKNAASFESAPLSPGEIAVVLTPDLTSATATAVPPLPDTLGGVRLTLTDSAGSIRRATLFYVSPAQLNFLVSADTAFGPATLEITTAGGTVTTAVVNVGPVSPGLFAANANGRGVASAQIVRVHADGTQEEPQNVATLDAEQTWTAVPIDVSSPEDEVYLVLYATGIRYLDAAAKVTINGQTLPALYAGAQQTYAGLDQVNVLLPATLNGAGTVDVTLAVNDRLSNTVTLQFQ